MRAQLYLGIVAVLRYGMIACATPKYLALRALEIWFIVTHIVKTPARYVNDNPR